MRRHTLPMRRTTVLTAVGLSWALALTHAVQATEVYSEGELIVTLLPGATIQEVNATWGTTVLDSFPTAGAYLLFAQDVGDLEAFADFMEVNDARVDESEANYFEDTPEGIRAMVFVAVGGTFGDYEDQELTNRIGLDEAHTWSRGAGVRVAIIDTGIDPAHEAFAGRLSPDGYDFIDDDSDPSEVANGVDDDQDLLTDEGFGHGTMVAGIVALVAPDATIIPIRALDDEGRADAWTLVKAISYAVDVGADVINMSFGVPRSISPIGHRIDAADLAGIVVVAGAGNENREEPVYYPGDHSKTILVTALDSLDVKADFADYNGEVLVSAPGTGVRTAYPGSDWALGSGCSFATPFVTGEVALILSRAPGMWPELVETRVESAVQPIYAIPGNLPYEDRLGSGRIFLPYAVSDLVTAVPDAGTVAPRLRVTPNPTSGALRVDMSVWQGLLAGSSAEMDIFTASGRRVRSLSTAASAGLLWDGLDARGGELPAGVYYVRLRSGGQTLGTTSVQKLR